MFMVLFFMKDTGRMYGLDALRGVAMSLGIFLHSSIAYKKGYHYGEWVFDKEFNSYFFDWLYLWINSFRMQAFFLLAGFFAHLLIKKIGLYQFAKNRLKRIVLPLLLSYFTILPLTLAPYFLFVEFKGADSWQQLLDFISRFYTFRAQAGFMHLWFLQHLLVFYAFLIPSLILINATKLKFTFRIDWVKVFSNLFIFLFVSSIVLGCISLLFTAPLPSIWTGFIIPMPQFIYYIFFFLVGWALESRRELFHSVTSSYKTFVILGTLLSFFTVLLINSNTLLSNPNGVLVLKFLFSFQTMLLAIGLIGLFNRVFNKANPFWLYVADSAYWVYLIHMPFVLITQLLLLNSAVPGILRFPIVASVAIFISFGSYHFFVRYTWIGTMLNGKRTKSLK
jgi:glucan biosynthesis protein C